MPVQVVMPRLGESVDEGTITKWLKAEGDSVQELEPLLEVNTDKVDTEIPSPVSGTLIKIEAQEGTLAQVGMVLAWIGETGEDLAGGALPEPAGLEAPAVAAAALPDVGPQAIAADSAPAAAELTSPGRHPQLGFISPVVAQMAAEFQIDLTAVEGTGTGGRITKKDLERYLESAPTAAPLPPSAAPAAPAPATGVAASAPAVMPGELLTLDTMRRAIADHMVMSRRTSPHVSTIMEVDLLRVTAHREANKATFARDGVKLTFTAYFVAATVAALKAQPLANSSWTDEGIRLHKEIHIGMATALDTGLIVPVIHHADTLSLLGIARTVNDLANRARSRQLKPDEVRGGTFTITNHGTSGSLFATPIINQPQCGILGVGAIQKRVVVINEGAGDAIAIRPMAYLSFTFDHRIMDGASADGFLGKVVESLQNWS